MLQACTKGKRKQGKIYQCDTRLYGHIQDQCAASTCSAGRIEIEGDQTAHPSCGRNCAQQNPLWIF